MRATIYLNATDSTVKDLWEVRASSTHSLLALYSNSGILLYDRRIKSQMLLTWEEILAMHQQVTKEKQQEQAS